MKKVILLVLMLVSYLLLSSLILHQLISSGNAQTSMGNVNPQLKSLGSATKLPPQLTTLQIKYLEVGKYGFSVPKAMVVDEEGSCYLLGWIELDHGKDFPRLLIKIERKVDGYYVFVRKDNEIAKWSREHIFHRADKLRDMDLIPVKKIIVIMPK